MHLELRGFSGGFNASPIIWIFLLRLRFAFFSFFKFTFSVDFRRVNCLCLDLIMFFGFFFSSGFEIADVVDFYLSQGD